MSKDLQEHANKECVLEVRTGSHLYGTNTPESDDDYVGVFLPPKEYIVGLKKVNEVDLSVVSKQKDGKNTSEAIDRKMYEFRKFVSLAQDNNPNILEILFANEKNIIHKNYYGDRLLDIRHCFPSQLCIPKFLGYAKSQKHKMIIRSDKFHLLREGYKVLCEKFEDKQVMAQVYDAYQNEFLVTPEGSILIFHKPAGVYHIACGDIYFEPGTYVKKARRMIKERLDKVTNRSELMLKHGYDCKFGSHLIRLLIEGLEIVKTGILEFPLKQASFIKDIRNGKFTANEVVSMADELEKEIESAQNTTVLPKTPNYQQIEHLVVCTNLEWLSRTTHRAFRF